MTRPRKPKIEMYWSTEKKTKDEIAAEKAAAKRKGVLWSGAESKIRHVINWRLVGANGEVMCQCTQGFTSRQSARENIERCGHLIFSRGMIGGTKIIGPGRTPL